MSKARAIIRRRLFAALVVVVAAAAIGYLTPSIGRGAGSQEIVFSADRVTTLFGEIYRVGLDGRRTNLTRNPARDVSPIVSPDGRWVAFASDRGGSAALYVVGLDGRRLRRLSPRLFPVGGSSLLGSQIAWSPDSSRLAMAAEGAGSAAALYVGGLDGRGRVIYRGVTLAGPVWSPDSRLIAFGTGMSGRDKSEVRVVTPAAATAWRARGTDLFHLSWSKTGRLAIGMGGRTIQVRSEQGRLLSSFPGQAFAWSPKSDRLASMNGVRLEVRAGGFGNPISSVAILRPDEVYGPGGFQNAVEWVGEQRIAVANGSGWTGFDLTTGRHWQPRQAFGTISPDGVQTAADVRAGSIDRIEISALDGRGARTLLRVPACVNNPPITNLQFTPDASAVVYQSGCFEPGADLYAMTPDGRGLRRLTHTVIGNETYPSWSPDGQRVAFVYQAAAGLGCHGCPATIWTMDPNGSQLRRLTAPRWQTNTTDISPSWAPDGRTIVFSRASAVTAATLFEIPAAGGRARNLHIPGSAPAWGPTRIAYMGADHPSVWTVDPDGRHRQRIATVSVPLAVAWSRDGRLAYVEQHQTTVTVHIVGATARSFRIPLRATSLAWSPDGKTLLLSTDDRDELYRVRTDGRHLVQLTSNMGMTHGVTWR